jgi:hypothetical protein
MTTTSLVIRKRHLIVNGVFGVLILAVIFLGVGRYLWLYHQDANAPQGAISEGSFLEGRSDLLLAASVAGLIAIVWAFCRSWLKGPSRQI